LAGFAKAAEHVRKQSIYIVTSVEKGEKKVGFVAKIVH
jgi:hypothetical protein